MSRKVYVTSDMGKDDALLAVYDECPQAALLWPWFITAFDDWGRCHANARILRREVFPLFDHITAEDVDATLALYAKHGLVTLYRVGGKPYVCIRPQKWWRYQTHIHEEKRKLADDPVKGSHHPAPPLTPPSDAAREDAHTKEGSADFRASPRKSAERSASFPPSPSPSPSPSLPPSPASYEAEAPDAFAPDAATEEPPKTQAAPKPPKVDRVADFIDAVRALGLTEYVPTPGDTKLLSGKSIRQPLRQIAEVYAAIAEHRFGDEWMRDHLSVATAVNAWNGYQANRAAARNGVDRRPMPDLDFSKAVPMPEKMSAALARGQRPGTPL